MIYRTNRWHIVFTLAFLNLQLSSINLDDEMDRMVMASQQIVPLICRSKQLYLHAVTNTFHRKDGRGAVQPFVLHRGRFLSTEMEKKKFCLHTGSKTAQTSSHGHLYLILFSILPLCVSWFFTIMGFYTFSPVSG